jgi:hypothetical protein
MSRYRDLWWEALCDAYGELYERYIAEHPDASDDEVFEALEFSPELQAKAERLMIQTERRNVHHA